MPPKLRTKTKKQNIPSRKRLLDWLSHQSWQGIGAIASIAACIVAIVAIVLTTKPPVRATATPTVAIPTSEPFKLTYITFDPPSPSGAENIKIFSCTRGYGGIGITLKVSVNTSPDGTDSGDWIVIKELGVPCFRQEDAPVWNTSTWLGGTYLVKVQAKGPDNETWDDASSLTTLYQLQKP